MLPRALLLLVVVFAGRVCHAQPDEAMLRLPVQVRLPDGSAAAAARICLMQFKQPRIVVETDSKGVAFLESNFVLTPTLAVESQDHRFNALVSVPQSDVRRLCQSAFSATLNPTVPMRVKVTRDGVPVDDAEVARGKGFVHVRTDGQGIATLPMSPPAIDTYVMVWHPEKGIGSAVLPAGTAVPPTVEVSLEPPVERKIRLLNQFDMPIADRRLAAQVLLSLNSEPKRRFFLSEEFPMTACRTDADGRASFLWASPRRRPYYELFDAPDWSMDGEPHSDAEPDPDSKILHVLHARARVTLFGELLVPDGLEKRGMLIRAVSDGVGSSFDYCSARSDDDGKFRLHVTPGHTYALAVEDSEWASDVQNPVFIPNPPELPPVLKPLEIVPAVPLEVIVTSKKTGRPIPQQFVEIGRRVVIERDGEHGRLLATWWKTDQAGRVRTGIATGEYEIRVPGEGWEEKQTLSITTAAPQRVEILGP
ncbi:Nickel uptake substrate-specific transmembrane region [Caulifigura coniformis]|uniref:Nickel uptake substrate-specific transmembrane region n=1 Tax=Caulifigura coniformis TaxID=2527983 RepID=A0A517SH23_9PLAN|nr:DUF4198 domain-containing protein [Caulifigura coniformis]QDT55412.1 Nickel uptake substrate-specific transmembrane region [Caulifigura coniformis]